MFHFLPNWLYGLLPLIYVGVGGIVLLALDNGWGLFSGGLLIGAGIGVAVMRAVCRRSGLGRAPAQTRPSSLLDSGVINRETLKLAWDDAYRSGNRVIDTQHRQLFDLGNSLLDAIRRKEQDSEIAFFLDTLMADLSHHFRTEEEEMLKVGHKLGKSHRDEHRALEARARRLRVQFEEGQLSLEDLFSFFANDVLALHIAQERNLFGRQA